MNLLLLTTLLLIPQAPKPGAPVASTIPALAKSVNGQKHDAAYTAKIREFTTEPFFLTKLVDHLPASDRIPTPEKFNGYIAGAPNKLTDVKQINAYMRELARTSPRMRMRYRKMPKLRCTTMPSSAKRSTRPLRMLQRPGGSSKMRSGRPKTISH